MGWIEKLLCWLLPYRDIVKVRNGKKVLYLRRWFILGRDDSHEPMEKRGWRLCIHKICQSDDDRDPHDHVWSFGTLILWGGYTDESYHTYFNLGIGRRKRSQPMRDRLRFLSFRWRRAEHLHQVRLENNKPSWNLVFMTKPSRPAWGFVLEDGTWVNRKEYLPPEEQ